MKLNNNDNIIYYLQEWRFHEEIFPDRSTSTHRDSSHSPPSGPILLRHNKVILLKTLLKTQFFYLKQIIHQAINNS